MKPGTKASFLDKVLGRIGRLDAQGVGFVRQHQRKVNQRPRPFLAPALADSRSAIRTTILRGLTQALQGGH